MVFWVVHKGQPEWTRMRNLSGKWENKKGAWMTHAPVLRFGQGELIFR